MLQIRSAVRLRQPRKGTLNVMSDKKGYTVQIVIAIIGLIGILGTAIITNWDKIFPPPTPGLTPSPMLTEQTTDGWAIIGKTRRGKYFDLTLELHGDTPAIGRSHKAAEDFRLVQKRRKKGENLGQVITLGMVHRGDLVEILDLHIPTPSTETVFVWAKLRAVLHPIQR